MTTELFNTVSSSFDTISGYVLSTLPVVVPIALGIFAIFIVWRFARKMFVSLVFGRGSKKEQEEAFLDQDFEDEYDDEDD